MFIQVFSHAQHMTLHTLTWRLVSALEMSHHQATNKTIEWKDLCIIGGRSLPLQMYIKQLSFFL